METTTPDPHFEFLTVFTSLWEQLIHAPSHLLLFVFLMPFGILIKRSPLPNTLIPWVLMTVGAACYPLLASPKNVSPDFPHPALVLGIYGALLGVGAMIAHVFLQKVKWFRKAEDALVNSFRRGDTQMFKRPTNEAPPKDSSQ